MSDELFTPSTAQVRSHYVFNQSDQWDAERGVQFDHWLAAHDADLTARVTAEIMADWDRGEKQLGDHIADLTARLAAAEQAIEKAVVLHEGFKRGQPGVSFGDLGRVLSAYRPVAGHPEAGGD